MSSEQQTTYIFHPFSFRGEKKYEEVAGLSLKGIVLLIKRNYLPNRKQRVIGFLQQYSVGERLLCSAFFLCTGLFLDDYHDGMNQECHPVSFGQDSYHLVLRLLV
jgi:hypothetical protein